MKKVAAAIIEKNGKYLIAQRAKNDPFKDKWEFPGGKVEPGETLEEALQRELFEELSIHATIGHSLCSVDFFHNGNPMQLVAFKIESFSGNLKLNVHQAIDWVTSKNLINYDFPEPDLPIVQLLTKKEAL